MPQHKKEKETNKKKKWGEKLGSWEKNSIKERWWVRGHCWKDTMKQMRHAFEFYQTLQREGGRWCVGGLCYMVVFYRICIFSASLPRGGKKIRFSWGWEGTQFSSLFIFSLKTGSSKGILLCYVMGASERKDSRLILDISTRPSRLFSPDSTKMGLLQGSW